MIVAVASLCLLLGGFGAEAATPRIYKIGLLINASTPSASSSNPEENNQRKGLEMALRSLPNYQQFLSIHWLDIGESAESTVKILPDLKSQDFDYLIGASFSHQAAIVSKFLQDNGLRARIISPSATSDELIKNDRIILMSNPNSTQARLMVEKSKATAQDKILVVDVTDCLYCTNLAKLLRENLERKGLRATSRAVQESEILDKKNFKDLSGFSKIFVPALEISTADVVAALWDGNSTAEFWAGDGVGSMGRYLKALPFAKSLRVRWIANYHPDIAVAENRLFVKEFKKVHGNPPIDTSAFSYEALRYVALELIQRKPINKWLTGSVVMKPRHAVRAMPIMTLRDGESKLLELARP